ncbi:DUF916 domain-containing protein [Deinococcus multiflagellatus]|uniref:DUF916 domain-containing protein n=1 Tax=Deinococcus multiflagellatus TaxID=1656887 RepID=A0ABW1ZGZ7_9DEIO|nr:DUF916 domain-containing protein [Deinococcus multiflagellatus]MBZ9713719.1 DUF916 domain-containing protein [Deinococcus multiflagellatus]
MRLWFLALLCCLLGSFARADLSVTTPLVRLLPLRAGMQHEGRITFQNTSALPLTVRVAQADFHLSVDQGAQLSAPGSTPQSNAPWVTVDNRPYTLAAGESVTVPFRVQVPADAPNGSRWSAILVEANLPTVPVNTPDGAKTNVSVQVVRTYVTSVVTVLGETGAGAVLLDFARPTLALDTRTVEGKPQPAHTLNVEFLNAGVQATTALLTAQVFSGGKPVAQAELDQMLALPGEGRVTKFSLPLLPPGDYEVVLLADAGGDDVFGARFALTVRP